MTSERRTIRRYHPGEYIKDALEALDMTAKEFSLRTGISERMLSGIIKGECDITFDTAFKLSEYFDNSINFWTNLQNQYNSFLNEQEVAESIKKDWTLVKSIKKYLKDCHYIEENDDNQTIVLKARKLCGVNQLTLLDKKDLLVCFKEQSNTFGDSYFYQNFWIALALNEARKNESKVFNKEKLENSLHKIRHMTTLKADVFYPQLLSLFDECGISFVLLPYLSKSNIYGVTKWLSRDNVVLSVSNRGEKADVFWFTICHELAHVLMEHKREALMSINGLEDKVADNIAEDILIPRKEWNDFALKTMHFTPSSIQAFARSIGVHPCIVLGRLHKEKLVPYGKFDQNFALSYKVVVD